MNTLDAHLRMWFYGTLVFGGLGAAAFASDPPMIGSAWAWGWAGERGEHLTLVEGPRGLRVERMTDLSGRGNHFFNYGSNQGAYQSGLSIEADEKGGAYATDLKLIGLDRYADGSQVYGNVYYQERRLNAAGPMYLAAVCMNTRIGGQRELFGTDAVHSLRIDQERDNVQLCINGTTRRVSRDGACPRGILLLEVWRDSTSRIVCMGNGADISAGVTMGQTFAVSGLGFDGSGSSQWDDYLMEVVMCDGLPTASEREALREYLRAKWDIWDGGGTGGDEDGDPPLEQDSSFADDFEDRSIRGWTVGKHGNWAEYQGFLHADNYGSSYGAWAAPTDHKSGEVTVRSSVQFGLVPNDGSWHAVSLQACKSLISDGPAKSGYALQLRSDGYLRLLRGGQVLASTFVNIDRNQEVDVSLSVYRGSVLAWLNGEQKLSAVDPAPLAKGYAGVGVNGCEASFLDFEANVAPVVAVSPPDDTVIESAQKLRIRYKDLRSGGSTDPMLVGFSVGLNGGAPFNLDFWSLMHVGVEEDGTLDFSSEFDLPSSGYSAIAFHFIAVDFAGNVLSQELDYYTLFP